jgi:hypothetical protein
VNRLVTAARRARLVTWDAHLPRVRRYALEHVERDRYDGDRDPADHERVAKRKRRLERLP